MKKLSGLTALLLAIILLICSAAQAQTGIQWQDLDIDAYNSMVKGARSNDLVATTYEYYLEQLIGLTVEARYDKLVSWHDSILGGLFYGELINYYKTTYPGQDLICTCPAPLPYGGEGHADGCPWGNPTEVEISSEEAGVSVIGSFPADVELTVTEATLQQIMAAVPADEAEVFASITGPCKAMDISMFSKGAEWQPAEGETVTVSMDVSDICENGDELLVFHVHEGADGVVTADLMGPYKAEDGEISFGIGGFSYVLVFPGSNANPIDNVEAFYTGSFPSGNGQYQLLGVYYDSSYNLHMLIAALKNNSTTKLLGQIKTCFIDGTCYVFDNLENEGRIAKVDIAISKLDFQDETDTSLLPAPITLSGPSKGFIDINLGTVQINNVFRLAVSQDESEPTSSSGWNVVSDVTLDLENRYEVKKTVINGTTIPASDSAEWKEEVTVNRGDTVIFQIYVDNNKKDSVRLSGMLVEDILPTEVFEPGTVKMSIDGVDCQPGSWQPFNQTLFTNYISEPGNVRTLYVMGMVKPDLPITQNETYTNTVTIDGNNMPAQTDTAKFTVIAPTTGELRVMKTVITENPNIEIPDESFTFTVHSDAAAAANGFTYKLNGTGNDISVGNNGTFTLKNGQTAVFAGFPNGAFTVTESEASGYTTTVNGERKNVYSGTMQSLAAQEAVSFLNSLRMSTSDLVITKTIGNSQTPSDTDEFSFSVEIIDNMEATVEYDYSIEGTSITGVVRGGANQSNVIQMKAGQRAIIADLPVGATYTVTETNIPDDYEFVSADGTDEDQSAEGQIAVGNNTAAFVNNCTITTTTTTLTIKKTGLDLVTYDGAADRESAIFEVTVQTTNGEKTFYVALQNKEEVTIADVIIGSTYSIAEQNDWSWRYAEKSEITGTAELDEYVEIDNTHKTTQKWLGGENYQQNVYTAVTTSGSN